ncbi:uncharacterized protein [Haliotis asinina]|uniref:uncharacterized protein n=1 Tax=Haliotis asinina TaxID=109174 RepID=UPI003531A8F0
MALPEDLNEEGGNREAVSGNGAVGGTQECLHPIPTTDAFAGELPDGSNADTLSSQAVLGAMCKMLTSVSGSEALDVVSKNTVMQKLGSLSISPQIGFPPNSVKDSANEHANEVASSDTARERLANSTENPDEALNAPPLSLNSLKSSLPLPPLQTDTIVERQVMEDDPKVKGACVKTETGLRCGVSHFAEIQKHRQRQEMTSGYVSECTNSNSRANNSNCRLEESRVNSISCRSKESKPMKSSCRSKKTSEKRCTSYSEFLQLSEKGLKELLVMSGIQRKPVHKDYHSFASRLQSFKDSSCVCDVEDDILALAGFFYSGSGTVTCYHCGFSPRIWTEGSDPKRLHWQWTPNCRFIRRFAKRFSKDSSYPNC